MNYRAEPAAPLRRALMAICDQAPPDYVGEGVYSARDLNEVQVMELQGWCSSFADPEWSTGIGILEAAELIVREAVSNGNIPPRKESYRKVIVYEVINGHEQYKGEHRMDKEGAIEGLLKMIMAPLKPEG